MKTFVLFCSNMKDRRTVVVIAATEQQAVAEGLALLKDPDMAVWATTEVQAGAPLVLKA